MNTKKAIAMISAVVMFGAVAAACGSTEEGKTPHTTYSMDDINNMSEDELAQALENAASEIEQSESAEQGSSEEAESIDLWQDVEVTFSGAEYFMMIKAEYVGDNQVIKDNVELCVSGSKDNPDTVYSRWNGEDYLIEAWYDEDELKSAGVVLKKNKDVIGPYNTSSTDYKFYTASNLGPVVEITDETDTKPFAAAVDAATERIKAEVQNGEERFQWAKDKEIYPTEFYIKKGDRFSGEGYISYSDKDGNFLTWIDINKVNYLNADGSWCRDVWMKYEQGIGYDTSNPLDSGWLADELVKVEF